VNGTSKIDALRQAVASLDNSAAATQPPVPTGFSWVDKVLKGGLRRGALHEVYAARPGDEAAATGFAAGMAKLLMGRRPLLWIRQNFSALEYGELSATGFLELGLDPDLIYLLRVPHAEDALKAASDALSCAGLGAIVIELRGEARTLDLVASRKLTLGAAQKNVSAILLRFNAKPDASTAETRWRIAAGLSPEDQEYDWGQPRFEAHLLRNRRGQLGHWVMEWSTDNGVFREPHHTPDHRTMVPSPSDRPLATQVEGARGGAPVGAGSRAGF
jgi:protein ImuA